MTSSEAVMLEVPSVGNTKQRKDSAEEEYQNPGRGRHKTTSQQTAFGTTKQSSQKKDLNPNLADLEYTWNNSASISWNEKERPTSWDHLMSNSISNSNKKPIWSHLFPTPMPKTKSSPNIYRNIALKSTDKLALTSDQIKAHCLWAEKEWQSY